MNARRAFPLILALALSACSFKTTPPPPEYVGEWRATGYLLVITADGGVNYERTSAGGHTRGNGPLREFHGDDFVVGLPYMNTTFKVTKRPYRDGNVWKMVVDGVEVQHPAAGP